jgi:hypothetical protein
MAHLSLQERALNTLPKQKIHGTIGEKRQQAATKGSDKSLPCNYTLEEEGW